MILKKNESKKIKLELIEKQKKNSISYEVKIKMPGIKTQIEKFNTFNKADNYYQILDKTNDNN